MKKFLLLTALTTSFVLPQIASANLTAVGAADRATGFPTFYQDITGLKLALCLDPAHCGALAGVRVGRPIKFPGNFPTTSFFFDLENTMSLTNGGSIEFSAQIVAGFATPKPKIGQQTVGNFFRIRGFDLPVGTYKITHPWGVQTFTVATVARRGINFTFEVAGDPGVFGTALGGTVGPFLKWDPTIPPLAPVGFVGEAGVPHTVVGSPNGTNFIKVEFTDAAGGTTQVGMADQLAITGKLAP